MKNSKYSGSSEYKKTIRFLELGCNCGCSKMIPRENYVRRFKLFLGLSKTFFLMAQLKAMNGGEITVGRRLKKKTRINKRTFYY